VLRQLREAVGLRDLSRTGGERKAPAKAAVVAPQFKQYREADGRFYFKLVAADGRTLLQSLGHASARDAGQLIARLKHDGGSSLAHAESLGVHLGTELLGKLAEGVAMEEVVGVLATFIEDDA
jgi:tryptophanyl-tRNA synthetase